MTITRAQALILLEPKLSNIWFDAYPDFPTQFTKFVNMRSAQKYKVTDYRMTGFGQPADKAEGQPPAFDAPIFGGTKEYVPVKKALAYRITEEMMRHELYGTVDRLERELMRSIVYQQEISGALLLNNGFSASVPVGASEYSATGFDGLALFSTAHTRLDGGATQANKPSTDVDLSVTGLQNALIQFRTWKNDRGRPVDTRARLLVIHPNDEFTAAELVKSEYKPGTANNDINEIKNMGISYTVNQHLTDADAWFLVGDQHDLNFIWDKRPYSQTWDSTDGSEVLNHMVVESFAVGFGSWIGAYGSQGAS